MQRYDFHTAASLEDALHYLAAAKGRCKIIAGGTDLIPALRGESEKPDSVLNIMDLKELKAVEDLGDELRIGPCASFTQLEESGLVQKELPLLAAASSWVGSPQIRNRGTIGGNICTGSPAADGLPACMALDARLELRSSGGGARVTPLAEFYNGAYKTCMDPKEMLTAILIPKPKPGTRSGFLKLGRRHALTRARMNMSVLLLLDGQGRVENVSIVPGAVMPVAKRMRAAEEALLGGAPDPDRVDRAAQAMVDAMVEVTGVRWSTEYKAPVMQNVFRRVLRDLLAQ